MDRSKLSTIGQIAYDRAVELMANDDHPFESFKEAFDVGLEEIIDECKYLMGE